MSEKNLQNSDDQEYWKFVERTAREVRETPKWMGGDESDDESSSSALSATDQHSKRHSKQRTT